MARRQHADLRACEEEQRVLGEIRKRLGAASTVVAEYAAPERERERVMKTLGTRSSGG